MWLGLPCRRDPRAHCWAADPGQDPPAFVQTRKELAPQYQGARLASAGDWVLAPPLAPVRPHRDLRDPRHHPPIPDGSVALPSLGFQGDLQGLLQGLPCQGAWHRLLGPTPITDRFAKTPEPQGLGRQVSRLISSRNLVHVNPPSEMAQA